MSYVNQTVYYNPYPDFLSEPLPFLVIDELGEGDLVIENAAQDLMLTVNISELKSLEPDGD